MFYYYYSRSLYLEEGKQVIIIIFYKNVIWNNWKLIKVIENLIYRTNSKRFYLWIKLSSSILGKVHQFTITSTNHFSVKAILVKLTLNSEPWEE